MTNKTNTYAILSLVFAFILFPLGLIFGIMALSQIKKTHEEGKGLAIAGIVVSLIPVIFLFLFFSFIGFIFNVLDDSFNDVQIITASEDTIVQKVLDTKIVQKTTGKIKKATISVDRVQIQLSNLYPSRVTVTNTGDVSIRPKFDILVIDSQENEICSGSPIINPLGSISPGQKKTGELTIMGCMFTEDGTYTLKVDLLDRNYNKLDTSSKNFNINYWGKFNFG